MSQEGIIPSVSNAANLGSYERSFGDIYAGYLNASGVYTGSLDASWEIRSDRLIAFNSYSSTPGEFILGSGWSHGDWRMRVDGDDLVFEQYDDGTWEWIEKYRIPATE